MTAIRCEFCGRDFDPAGGDPSGRHSCCGVRSAGALSGAVKAACRIRGEIGRGASGVVYLADQLRLQRPVALKLLYDNPSETAEKLFFSEVRAAGKLQHPNIVRIYSIGETDERIPYSIMEYVDGETLEDAMGRGVRFSEPEVRRIASGIADALAYAWETAGLTHGDLKPANVMLRRKDKSVCILDLGLQSARMENGITSAMGTPLYAAPELVNDTFGSSDFRSDVYSLGIMIYELLSGKAPFEGTPEEVGKLHQSMDAEPLRKKVPGVTKELSDLVTAMLSRYAAERPDWAQICRILDVHPAVPAATAPRKPSRAGCLLGSLLLLLAGGVAGGAAVRYLPKDTLLAFLPAAQQDIERGFLLAEQGDAPGLAKLLNSGLPVNAVNSQGNTLLMQSVFFGREDVVRLLLKYPVDLKHRNNHGETVFDLVSDFPEIRRLLQTKSWKNNHAEPENNSQY